MKYINYLVLLNLQGLDVGLRQDKEFYYLDFLITKDNETNAIQRFKKLKSSPDLKDLTIIDNKHKLILITNILTEYLLSVK